MAYVLFFTAAGFAAERCDIATARAVARIWNKNKEQFRTRRLIEGLPMWEINWKCAHARASMPNGFSAVFCIRRHGLR